MSYKDKTISNQHPSISKSKLNNINLIKYKVNKRKVVKKKVAIMSRKVKRMVTN